jgi:mannose/cellobiose epimerase-like protein (N-acyl-D-glucosamine 2-epimerase family)
MNTTSKAALIKAQKEIRNHLEKGIIPFWDKRAVDREYGGFLCRFDDEGNLIESETEKGLISQTRLIWGFSNFYRHTNDPAHLEAAKQGVDFFIEHFWDKKYGGWYWMVQRDGSVKDPGKVLYGIAFAIYALSEYYLVSADERGLEYACKTFDVLQKYGVDVANGGYFENLEEDWRACAGKEYAGDRKTLNTHMHIMEAFTTLYQASGLGVHKRRLEETIQLILEKMFHPVSGCCMAQFDLAFNTIPALSIYRSWDFERQGDPLDTPQETTCYGHNVEFAWLLIRAGDVLGEDHHFYKEQSRKLVDHAINNGLDYTHGGVYCCGLHEGPATNKDKEFWENMEVLPGFLDAYEVLGDEKYLKAFHLCWDFSNKYMINHELGEWIFLAKETGEPVWDHLGNNWKVNYHSGRSMTESLHRIEILLAAR